MFQSFRRLWEQGEGRNFRFCGPWRCLAEMWQFVQGSRVSRSPFLCYFNFNFLMSTAATAAVGIFIFDATGPGTLAPRSTHSTHTHHLTISRLARSSHASPRFLFSDPRDAAAITCDRYLLPSHVLSSIFPRRQCHVSHYLN